MNSMKAQYTLPHCIKRWYASKPANPYPLIANYIVTGFLACTCRVTLLYLCHVWFLQLDLVTECRPVDHMSPFMEDHSWSTAGLHVSHFQFAFCLIFAFLKVIIHVFEFVDYD